MISSFVNVSLQCYAAFLYYRPVWFNLYLVYALSAYAFSGQTFCLNSCNANFSSLVASLSYYTCVLCYSMTAYICSVILPLSSHTNLLKYSIIAHFITLVKTLCYQTHLP